MTITDHVYGIPFGLNLAFLSRDNFLKIMVYYGDLSYEYLEQKPTYDLLVFLGTSLLSYF